MEYALLVTTGPIRPNQIRAFGKPNLCRNLGFLKKKRKKKKPQRNKQNKKKQNKPQSAVTFQKQVFQKEKRKDNSCSISHA